MSDTVNSTTSFPYVCQAWSWCAHCLLPQSAFTLEDHHVLSLSEEHQELNNAVKWWKANKMTQETSLPAVATSITTATATTSSTSSTLERVELTKCSTNADREHWKFDEFSENVQGEEQWCVSTQLFVKYIVSCYCQPQRHYHTLEHIEQMLKELFMCNMLKNKELYRSKHSSELTGLQETSTKNGSQELVLECNVSAGKVYECKASNQEESETLLLLYEQLTMLFSNFNGNFKWYILVTVLAILFHDSVYIPERNDNESESVNWLQEFLNEARVIFCAAMMAKKRRNRILLSPLPDDVEDASSNELYETSALSGKSDCHLEESMEVHCESEQKKLTIAITEKNVASSCEQKTSQNHYTEEKSTNKQMLVWEDMVGSALIEVETIRYIHATAHHLQIKPSHEFKLINGCTVSGVNNDFKKKQISEESALDECKKCIQEKCRDMIINYESKLCADDLSVTCLEEFLDIDLSILGQAENVYSHYVRAIRQEYCHLTEEEFCKGRLKFLKHFLSYPQWYKSRYFFDKYEAKARINVQSEVDTLENQTAEVEECIGNEQTT